MGTQNFSAPGAGSFVVPAGVTSMTVDMQAAAGGASVQAGGQGQRLQTTLTVTPGETLYAHVPSGGASVTDATGGAGGAQGAGLGPGAAGGGAAVVMKTSASKANAVLIAAGGGGGSGGGAGSQGTGVDTQAATPDAATAGATGTLGLYGGGGGGGGWDSGTGGAAHNGGNTGRGMYHTTYSSAPTATNTASAPYVNFSWTDPPPGAPAASTLARFRR